jgi:hypothetical protein
MRPSACWEREFESHRGHGSLSCTVFVLSGRGLCDGPIPRPEESYRLWRVLECDHVKIRKTLYTCCEQVGRRGKEYKQTNLWGKDQTSVKIHNNLTPVVVRSEETFRTVTSYFTE